MKIEFKKLKDIIKRMMEVRNPYIEKESTVLF